MGGGVGVAGALRVKDQCQEARAVTSPMKIRAAMVAAAKGPSRRRAAGSPVPPR